MRLVTTCDMEVRKYPFHAQNCPIKLASVGRASTIPLIKIDRWANKLGLLWIKMTFVDLESNISL